MENHKRDLKLMAESIIENLEYNSIHKYETKKDIEMIIDGILPCLLRNCHELNIMEHVRHMMKVVEKDKSMTNEEFIKEVFEIAFGDDAKCVENNEHEVKAREFTKEEALEQLKEFRDIHYMALTTEEIK